MLQNAYNHLKFLTLGRSSVYTQSVKTHTIEELKKDLFGRGDLTTNLLGKNREKVVKAKIIAKDNGILAGLHELKWFLKKNKITILEIQKDQNKIKKGEIVLQIQGKAKNILKTERVALNLIQRMSGIATLTHQNLAKIPENILLAGTRKTLWGLLDKKAIITGGGSAHRLGLWHAVLIKENHLKLADYKTLLKKAWYAKKRGAFLEIETESKTEALECANFIQKLYQQKPQQKPVVIMLDNFSTTEIAQTATEIKKIEPRIFVEVSGGINQENLSQYGKLENIDIISCGFLTHSAIALDMSLQLITV